MKNKALQQARALSVPTKSRRVYPVYPDSRSAEYSVFKNMVNRCLNRNAHNFGRYGAVGIHLMNDWNPRIVGRAKAFRNFYDAMGPRPQGKLPSGLSLYSIHRVDNVHLYSKWTCKWATSAEQTAPGQKKTSGITKAKGFYLDKARKQWKAQIRHNGKRLYVGRFQTKAEAQAAYKAKYQELYESAS
jgi:hypothetical protein